jgi:hypothetical protein
MFFLSCILKWKVERKKEKKLMYFGPQMMMNRNRNRVNQNFKHFKNISKKREESINTFEPF